MCVRKVECCHYYRVFIVVFGLSGLDYQWLDYQWLDYQWLDYQWLDYQGLDYQWLDYQWLDYQSRNGRCIRVSENVVEFQNRKLNHRRSLVQILCLGL